jgi:hypothetical protein
MRFVELDLIYDSPSEFLYRQKGQLKLDNTVIEEFLPRLLFRSLDLGGKGLVLGPGETFAGLTFGSSLAAQGHGGRAIIRTKEQDFIVGKRLFLMASFDRDFDRAEHMESCLGYVCAECKTNLDKTMFQEAVATSRDLKVAVPASLYFLVCGYLDMTPVSIAPTHIDDVLIVRKAKRMPSQQRQEYRSSGDRRRHRREYQAFLEAAPFCPDVFQRMVDKIQAVLTASAPAVTAVLARGHF